MNQRELGYAHTLSFANALRAALREDPDIILVGEMRDLDTIQLALTAAETGHLVFRTGFSTPVRRKPSTASSTPSPEPGRRRSARSCPNAGGGVDPNPCSKRRAAAALLPWKCMVGTTAVPEPYSRGQTPSDSRHHAGEPEGRHADHGHGPDRPGHTRLGAKKPKPSPAA
ncbi:MAG: Flp pilus assembly complex ATPase component TadA [Nitrospira sp.]|nr:Flp pilus assembly complex ATPase component TadA [Nitrospira sp.]